MKKHAFLIFGVALVLFGIAINHQDKSIYGTVFSSALLIAGSVITGRETKK